MYLNKFISGVREYYVLNKFVCYHCYTLLCLFAADFKLVAKVVGGDWGPTGPHLLWASGVLHHSLALFVWWMKQPSTSTFQRILALIGWWCRGHLVLACSAAPFLHLALG